MKTDLDILAKTQTILDIATCRNKTLPSVGVSPEATKVRVECLEKVNLVIKNYNPTEKSSGDEYLLGSLVASSIRLNAQIQLEPGAAPLNSLQKQTLGYAIEGALQKEEALWDSFLVSTGGQSRVDPLLVVILTILALNIYIKLKPAVNNFFGRKPLTRTQQDSD